LKLLRVMHSANPTVGGPIEGIRQITPLLAAMGHSTEVVSLDDPTETFYKDLSFPVHPLGPARGGYGYTPTLVPWLQQHARSYDYVIINGIWQYTSYGTWRALHDMKMPYCVFPHGMLDPWFKQAFPLKHLRKSLYWPWAEYRVLRDAHVVCFTCEEERVLARQSFRPYGCREAVVRYGTGGPKGDETVQRAAFSAAYPHLAGKRVILFLSRIHVKKGCDLLIQAFAAVAQEYPDLHLVMAGPDHTGWLPELKALATRLGVQEKITWTGMLAGDIKWGAFYTAEAFVLPSHQENFGIAVVEALACGRPVLISNKVNICREIEADAAGLVEPDTLEGATSLLRRWLALPADQRTTMQRQARECFLSRFEITQAAQSFIETLCHT
jgi:glycosyltransferase involved in cell wall biosynthesis